MRIGSICYANTQGLGYLAKAFYDNGVITDPIIQTHPHPLRPVQDWYPPNTPKLSPKRHIDFAKIGPVLERVDAMIFFETPFYWNILDTCRERGVKTILVPMYEWTPVDWPAKPDALFCPSKLDQDIFLNEFPDGCCPFIPIPVDNSRWQLRTRAKRWLHNAGNVGHREHKGTRELLKAAHLVNNKDWTLTVRVQDSNELKRIVVETGLDARVTVQWGEIAYEDLWEGYDVYIAPEKFNGLSLPLQESFAAGMLVVTTDRYPFNTWLPVAPLISPTLTQKARVSSGCREFDECIHAPITIAECIDQWHDSDIDAYSRMGRDWGKDHSWNKMRPIWLENVQAVVEGEPCQSF